MGEFRLPYVNFRAHKLSVHGYEWYHPGYINVNIFLVAILHALKYSNIKYLRFLKKLQQSRAVVAHACNPSTWEAEAGGFLSSRSAWSTEWVPGQPGLHRETLSRKNKKQNKTKKQNNNNNKKTYSKSNTWVLNNRHLHLYSCVLLLNSTLEQL